jgi:sortase A
VLVNPSADQDNDANKPTQAGHGYVFSNRKGRTVQPITKGLQASHYTPVKPITGAHAGATPATPMPGQSQPEQYNANAPHAQTHQTRADKRHDSGTYAAIQLIRSKVAALYEQEPDVREEIKEDVIRPETRLTKHQRFMHELTTSGKPLAQIQTDWHNYYVNLPDHEKHEVWREFYQVHNRQSGYAQAAGQQAPGAELPESGKGDKSKAYVGEHLPAPDYAAKKRRRSAPSRTKQQIKQQILNRVNLSAESQARAKQHFHSLVFGLGTGLLVLVIFLFGFFNEMFIAPFIQPSRHVSATPIIVSSDSVAVSDTPEVIIPKINVQIPLVFDEKSADEAAIQRALERGVIHYPTTVMPGQQGNAAFFGHSSNNIFNKGKYKFAFVLLHELVPGDIFYLTSDKKVYTYRVYDKRIVPPSEVSVLNNIPGKIATATLITCDPPGTSTNRLVVWGEQISPDPAGATAPTTPVTPNSESPVTLPSEGPTLWTRFWRWLF